MANLQELKRQIEDANALGRQNLTDKGVDIPKYATTYEIMQSIANVVGGSGTEYSSIKFNEDNTITLTDTDGTEHTMACVYEDDKLMEVTYDGRPLSLTYEDDKMYIGDTVVDLSDAPVKPELVVDYIESTGSQYIDTGIIPTNHRVVAKMQLINPPSNSSVIRALFGAMNSTYDGCYGVTYMGGDWYCYAGSRITADATSPTGITEFDFNNDNNEVVVNGKVVGILAGTCNIAKPFTIFARVGANGNSVDSASYCEARLYYFKIYDKTTNELVRDFIPTIDENGVVCLYDNVTKAYFYNQGSGEFVGRFIEKVGIEPLDNTVTFTVDGEPYEIVSVKNGNKVNAPATDPISESGSFAGWQLNEGRVDFPYPPESDVEIVALFGTIADTVYTHYGINKEEFPYLAIQYLSANSCVYVCFAKTVTITSSIITYTDCLWSAYGSSKFSDFSNIESAVQYALDNVPQNGFENKTSWTAENNARWTQYINFDKGAFTGTIYNI